MIEPRYPIVALLASLPGGSDREKQVEDPRGYWTSTGVVQVIIGTTLPEKHQGISTLVANQRCGLPQSIRSTRTLRLPITGALEPLLISFHLSGSTATSRLHGGPSGLAATSRLLLSR